MINGAKKWDSFVKLEAFKPKWKPSHFHRVGSLVVLDTIFQAGIGAIVLMDIGTMIDWIRKGLVIELLR